MPEKHRDFEPPASPSKVRPACPARPERGRRERSRRERAEDDAGSRGLSRAELRDRYRYTGSDGRRCALARANNATLCPHHLRQQQPARDGYADRYGNRTAQTVTVGSGPSNAVNVSAATNRLTDPGYSYDPNGNMTADGLNSLAYDAENRLVASSGSTHSYDGNNLRVQKSASGSTTVYIFSGAKVIAEHVNGAAAGSPTREYIYSASRLVATIEGGATKYHHADHLSPRVTTDSSGNILGQQGHYPYGESWYLTSTTTKWQFTTYERDSESGNDYAMARYHVNRLGRFSSPDRVRGLVSNPQSLNLYAYVANDPVGSIDPLGLARRPVGDRGDEDDLFYLTGGWGPGCQADGVSVPCGLADAMVGSGAGVQCPNNRCSGYGTDPKTGEQVYARYYAFSGGTTGYFRPEDIAQGPYEVDGELLTQYGYTQWAIQHQQGAAQSQADAVSALLKAGGDPEGGSVAIDDATFLQGGNLNFEISEQTYNYFTSEKKCGGERCSGELDGLHFENIGEQHYVHLDTANPWGSLGGFFKHIFVDGVYGHLGPYIIPRH